MTSTWQGPKKNTEPFLSGCWPLWSWWKRSSTCQDSHLTGKPGASQGVTVAGGPGGPIGYGRRHPNRAHGRRIIEFRCTTVVLCPSRGRDESPPVSGADTAPLHCVFLRLCLTGYMELVVSLKPPHRRCRITLCWPLLLRRLVWVLPEGHRDLEDDSRKYVCVSLQPLEEFHTIST